MTISHSLYYKNWPYVYGLHQEPQAREDAYHYILLLRRKGHNYIMFIWLVYYISSS